MDVQRNLEANVEKRTKDTYGPPPGRRLLVFMDDMNMPQVSMKFYSFERDVKDHAKHLCSTAANEVFKGIT